MNFTLERKITTALALGLVFILSVGVVAWQNTQRARETFRWVDHTHRVLLEAESFLNSVQSVQIEAQRFVLTADPSGIERWTFASSQVRSSLQNLGQLTADNPQQREILRELETLIAQEITLTQNRLEIRRRDGLEAAVVEVSEGAVHPVVDRILALIKTFKDTERALLEQRTVQTQSAARTAAWLIVTTSLLAIAVGGIAIVTIQREFRHSLKSEHALQDSVERIRDLYNRAPCGYHSLDADGTFLDINETELSWLGYTRDEIVGKKRFVDLTTPAGALKFNDIFSAFKSEGHLENVEFELVRRNGTIMVALLNATAIRDLSGKFIASRTTLYDITGRKQAEDERDRFFNLTRDLLCVASFDGYFRRLNPAWERTLGFTNQELMAQPVLTWVHPEDHARNTAESAKLRDGAESSNFENRYRTKAGTYRWLRWSAVSLPSERLIFASARDITDDKRLEQAHLEFSALFESLPGLYLVLKPDLTIVAASNAHLQATNTKRSHVIGKSLFEVFPDNPEDPTANGVSNLRDSLQRVIETNQSDTMAIQRYDVREPDGSFAERYWSPVNAPVFGVDRKLQYIVHRVEDVTDFVKQRRGAFSPSTAEMRLRLEQMEAETFRSSQQVQSANDRLRAVNQELEAFSYSVSHDLRAPLRHIDGFAGLLQKHATNLDDRGRRYIQVISDAAKQMGRLIDDLLAFSRVGRSHLSLVEADQNSLVDSIIRESRSENAFGKKIIWQISPLPRVQADVALLRQVWINLIDNAVKYSGKTDAPHITIGTQPSENPEEGVCFVRDNGVGFDMQYVGKLFGVFQRLHNPADFEGTGIGLANVQRIVVRHGGRVWAEGTPGQGATFYFSLPLTRLTGPVRSAPSEIAV